MKKNYQNTLLITILSILLVLYLLNPALIIKSILDYTDLFIKKLFPVSFIFYIISSLLIDYGLVEFLTNTLNLNGATSYVTIMSLISGFPSGAKYTKDLLDKNLLSEKEANYLIRYTHFPNPMFILGSVSTIFISKKIPVIILISLILSNFIIAIVYKEKTNKVKIPQKKEAKDFSASLTKAITSSIKILIVVYGISIFFFLISVVINNYIKLSPLNFVLINGIFDLTKGVFSTPLIKNDIIKAALIISFISLGSLSIHMQVKSIINDSNIKYKNFLISRLEQMILANIIFIILNCLL